METVASLIGGNLIDKACTSQGSEERTRKAIVVGGRGKDMLNVLISESDSPERNTV